MTKEKKFVVDAGHAGFGVTAGKRTPDGEYEWNFNNIIATALTNELLKYKNVRVKRSDDPTGRTDIPLGERVDMANDWGADAFFSIHHNAYQGIWAMHTGTETYTANVASKTSEELAKIAHKTVVKEYGLYNRGLKKAPFYVIKYTKMPAFLLECGYMDSKIDIKVMRKDEVLKATGVRLAKEIADYYNLELKAVEEPQGEVETSGKLYRVQVGAFKEIASVASFAQKVEERTGFTTYITEVDGYMKVQVGAFGKHSNAKERLALVKKAGYKDAFITTKTGKAVSIAEPANDTDDIPEIKTDLVGKKVYLRKDAKKYVTGQNIPTSVKGKKYTVSQDAKEKVLLKEIYSWVYKKDLGKEETVVVKKDKFNLPDRNYWNKSPQFNGEDIRIIQSALASIYFYPEKGAKNNGVDGYYGAKTADAVRRFQSVNGLRPDGIYGKNTRAKLDSLVNK